MKLRMFTIIGLILVLFTVYGCASGVSKEEYEAMLNKFNTMKTENAALLEENKSLKTQLETCKADVNKYKSNITKANSYAAFMDVYADIHRWDATKPTKHGYDGKGDNQIWLSKLHSTISETGDNDLKDKLERILSLQVGAQKDKAWADWLVSYYEGLFSVTRP